MKIVYVGCGLSGRRTSLSKVLASAGHTVDPLDISGDQLHEFTWSTGHEALHLVASVSTARSHCYYEDPAELEEGSPADIEIDEIARADGIIFVIDSQVARAEANLWQLTRLYEDLNAKGVRAESKPIIFQANKLDLDDTCSTAWIHTHFRGDMAGYADTAAINAEGTSEALTQLIHLMSVGQGPARKS